MKDSYSLKELGIYHCAFTREKALQVISKLKKANIGILGGDVLKLMDDGSIEFTNNNWSCNHKTGESHEHFVERSYYIAQEFIENYLPDKPDIFLFDIVHDWKPTKQNYVIFPWEYR
ncbi:MAG: Imm40 family immunity protein [Marinifilaceae bacterium]|nr:Imm40 family immunity protein [Marinifilaceae bacterium]